MTYKLALVGNPNSGKTTLFNELTGSQQYVGNWPGVTVEKKEGVVKSNASAVLVDLPGIYSLSPYTLEEVVSRNFLINDAPDAIINIVDATNIERNLYLTTQLLEMGIPIVLALNMIDVVRKRDTKINLEGLAAQLGCPVVEISALKGIGIKEVLSVALKLAEGNNNSVPKVRFSVDVESYLREIDLLLNPNLTLQQRRWISIKLFERDPEVQKEFLLKPEQAAQVEACIHRAEQQLDDDSESIVINARYEYIGSTLKQNFAAVTEEGLSVSDKIDRVVTSPWLALPIFAAVMFLVYYIAISTIGTSMTDWCNEVLFGEIVPNIVGHYLTQWNVNEIISSLILDGIVGGVGAVLGFLPQMMVLFFLLAILEDCGYMARIAFIMDKVFRHFGLSGKSFIPMLVSTGCGVPGIMAARTIENERDRKMTIITTTFMPCGAKLPIIALIAGAFFPESWWVAPSAYFLGILAVALSGMILKKTKPFQGEEAPFVMELPPYHLPGAKSLFLNMWDKAKDFVKRAGTLIFVASCAIWFLSKFNWSLQVVDFDHSMLAALGGIVAPIFLPLGWGDWKLAVGTLTGLAAKESVVATLSVLYSSGQESALWGTLRSSFSPLAGYSFLLFNLYCAPCFAAIGAMKKELGTKWMWIGVGYQTLFAYLLSLVVYQIGMLILYGRISIATVVAAVVISWTFYLIFRRSPKAKLAA